MNFSIIMLSCTKQQNQSHLSTVKMNGLCPPTASEGVIQGCKGVIRKAHAEIGFKGCTRSETERNQWVAAAMLLFYSGKWVAEVV
ncbi:MAG: hypothetical protein K2P65_09105 [Lachnospiraceae bacterium]|nr:hypothetical protein [Lachnospiraceae bacterium]